MTKKRIFATMAYYILDFIIQLHIFIFVEWIYTRIMAQNGFVLYCFAEMIWGKSESLRMVLMCSILTLFVFTCIFIINIFRKKYLWEIPFFIEVLNITTHIIFLWSEPMAYIGLLYKILGLLLYGYAIYDRKKFSKVENTEEKPEKIENHS